MDKKTLEHFRKLLLEKRKEMIDQIAYIKKNDMSKTTKEASGDHSSYSFHMADQGTDNMEREKSFLYAQRDGRYLYHLDMALDRVEEGTYGKCHDCGKEISHDRLEVVPHARYCIQCKTKEEGGH